MSYPGLKFQHWLVDSSSSRWAPFYHLATDVKRFPHLHPPSIPILPSPSLSPAAIRALVSATVSSLAPEEKFCRKRLKCAWYHQSAVNSSRTAAETFLYLWSHVVTPYLSSSSSMYPLLSWSRTVNSFFLSASDNPVSPTCPKKVLKSKVPGASQRRRGMRREEHRWGSEGSFGDWRRKVALAHSSIQMLSPSDGWHSPSQTACSTTQSFASTRMMAWRRSVSARDILAPQSFRHIHINI